tara:strand:+ start:7397 stop:8086 length:690 start_codon:yes stop_codon:yes gene_type:complete
MSSKFRNLKNDLKDLENDTTDSDVGISSNTNSSGPKTANYILVIAFIVTLLFYAGNRVSSFFADFDNPISEVVQSFNNYSPQLLADMGAMMEEMGYGVLTNEELSDLRNEGVTATETQRIRDAGYTSVTLDQLVELQDADVSATYASMMKELGYELSIEELIETRRNGVTANFTSRMMDLGYTIDELTKENLMRMRSIDVSDRLAERLIEERGERPTVDELVRYRISNQ